jgi:hypothetical protein
MHSKIGYMHDTGGHNTTQIVILYSYHSSILQYSRNTIQYKYSTIKYVVAMLSIAQRYIP